MLGFLLVLLNNAIAQPKSVEYEMQDFLMNVLWNPTFCLQDFRTVGLTSNNTELKSMNTYLNYKGKGFHSQMLKVIGKDDYSTRKMVYLKVAASWKVFKEIQYAGGDCHSDFFNNTSLELRHKLSIVPLKLEKY